MAGSGQTTAPSFLEGQRLARRVSNPPLRAVLAYWLDLHDGDGLPKSDRFDPDDIPADALPYLFVLEPGTRGHWRIRSLGAHVTAALGRDFSGSELVDAEIPNISRSRTVKLLTPVLESGLPGHFHGRSSFRFREDFDDHEQILLPLRAPDGSTIDLLIGAILYEGLGREHGRRPTP